MALFSRKQEEKTEDKAVVAEPGKESAVHDRNLASVIVAPRITEKSVSQGERNVYTFNVRKDATKYDVRDAVTALFNVTPVKVNIVNKQPRRHMSRMRGRVVSEKGYKKAYVYLKDGDTINLV